MDIVTKEQDIKRVRTNNSELILINSNSLFLMRISKEVSFCDECDMNVVEDNLNSYCSIKVIRMRDKLMYRETLCNFITSCNTEMLRRITFRRVSISLFLSKFITKCLLLSPLMVLHSVII